MITVFEVEDSNKISIEKLGLYYEIFYQDIDQYGWGLCLVAVDRWGKRAAIPYFDYNFADILHDVPQGSVLSAIKTTCDIEFRYAEKILQPEKLWDRQLLWDIIKRARVHTNPEKWTEPATGAEFWRLMKERGLSNAPIVSRK
ncbi:hypothetical protein [Mesorhizobium sp. SARCC-RB16n]|uniref:hypothetical protein n=1 Tax=Mesorhizobium sp. SARCC-RB16n TaxID=2116687 RepID=UPI00122F3FB2|nr:hypothetical protein [Mesorhizobium sp. SARCC-RB16n]